MALDQHLENDGEGGRSSSKPVLYSVGKSTSIPAALTLLRINKLRFFLQASSPVSVKTSLTRIIASAAGSSLC